MSCLSKKIFLILFLSSTSFAEDPLKLAQDQAVKTTQDLIKIDTTNPPGKEILAALQHTHKKPTECL